MTNLDAEVRHFITGLSKISDAWSLAATFETLVKNFQCKFFVISGIPDDPTNLQDMLIIHNLPEDWVTEYIANNYIMIDPIVRRCMEARDPFYWRDVDTSAAGEGKKVMLRAESYGLINRDLFSYTRYKRLRGGCIDLWVCNSIEEYRNASAVLGLNHGVQRFTKDSLGSLAAN